MIRHGAGWILVAISCGCASTRTVPVPVVPARALVVLATRVAQAAVEVVPLEHANAEDVASALQELLRPIPWWSRGCAVPIYGQENAMDRLSREPESQRVRIVALPRTNSLLLTGLNQARRASLRELIQHLDAISAAHGSRSPGA